MRTEIAGTRLIRSTSLLLGVTILTLLAGCTPEDQQAAFDSVIGSQASQLIGFFADFARSALAAFLF